MKRLVMFMAGVLFSMPALAQIGKPVSELVEMELLTSSELVEKQKAGFIKKHRFLIVKKTTEMDKQQWEALVVMFGYLPALRTLWYFAREVYGLFEKGHGCRRCGEGERRCCGRSATEKYRNWWRR